MSESESKTGLRVKGRLMSASEIERTLVRLAHEIVEKSNGSEDLALVGIKRRGVPLAERLGKLIPTIEKRQVDTGVLDIQFYRDDLSTAGVRPVVTPGAIGFDIEGRDIVICDDVLYTGRTIRAALDALFDHGRPRRVQLCGAHRPRPSRTAHRSHLRWQTRSHKQPRDHRSKVPGSRRNRTGAAGRADQLELHAFSSPSLQTGSLLTGLESPSAESQLYP